MEAVNDNANIYGNLIASPIMFYKANCTFSGLHELQASCPNPVTDERGQPSALALR